MRIAGRDYNFALTIDAFFAIEDLDIDKSRSFWNDRATVQTALIMSKAYEDRAKVLDPAYEPKPLSRELIGSLTPAEFKKLSEEVEAALKEGMAVTFKSQKKNGGRSITLNRSWFVFYGSLFGMNRQESLTYIYGEMKDLIECYAIFHGAEPAPKEWTFDEAMALE